MMKMNVSLSSFVFCIGSFFSTTGIAQMIEKKSTLNDQKSVAVTIYNENLALIRELRTVNLDEGINLLAFRGVSAKMQPETAMLRSISHGKGFLVVEQNFDYDLLTPQTLLEKYVGLDVRIATVNPASGKEIIEKATVLSTNDGVVLKIGDRIETNPKGRFIFNTIPDNLRDQPTLVIQLKSATSSPQQLELSYLSGGLSWRADYVAELNEDDAQLDLLGWVTLNNKSGTGYENAKLQLVAGDVNRIQPEEMLSKQRGVRFLSASPMVDDVLMAEESLFEYHLYNLNRKTSIANNQVKQVSLLSASSVPVSKEFVLRGADYYYHSQYGEIGGTLKVGVFVQFENKETIGLGIPIPKGIVRVYKKDKAGNAQFIGEDSIDHTPKNEKIRLKLGDAFDVTANKKQTYFSRHAPTPPNSKAFESTFQIELKNAKPDAVTVIVREPIPGDWEMMEESYKHAKIAAGVAEWRIEVPADSNETLYYRVRVQH